MILTGLVAIVFGIVIFAKPGAGALAVLALIAAFALVTGISELVVAIGGEKLLERKVKTFASRGSRSRRPSRRIDGRSARPHVLGAGDQVAGSACILRTCHPSSTETSASARPLGSDLGGSRRPRLGTGVASLSATVRRRFLERRCDDYDSN